MAGKKPVARRHVGKDAPKVAPKKNAAAAERKFGKVARQAAERGGRKPGAWRDAEQPPASLADFTTSFPRFSMMKTRSSGSLARKVPTFGRIGSSPR
jgi:hypothetical protein